MMDAARLERHLIAVMAKHLPPSASTLKLLDLDGRAATCLATGRLDLDIRPIAASRLAADVVDCNSFDAVVAFDAPLEPALLAAVLDRLRPGGRFIAVRSKAAVTEAYPRALSENGFVRILVEPALDGLGVLLRGEKAHTTANTRERISAVADADANRLDLESFKGRYLHLLIQQRPNKPVWKLTPRESVTWSAVAAQRAGQTRLLAFSSLPKAVAFLQPAVLADFLRDINKVGKFSRATAEDWRWDVLLNPTLGALQGETIALLEIDHATAEASDE